MKRLLFATVALFGLAPAAFAQSSAPVAPKSDAPGVVSMAPATQSAAVVVPTVMFPTIPTTEDLSSNLIGLDIYNNTKDKIGTVKDIAMTAGRVNAYIVGVGGFLGMGDHYVAVTPSAITINYDPTDKKWHATMNTDAAALKAAPEYKYAS
jgi:sporulation protein YlmC with PRC-barrel domain